MEKKKLNKTTKSNLITYGMVLAAYLIVQGMIAGNMLSNLMQGLLVPLWMSAVSGDPADRDLSESQRAGKNDAERCRTFL